jgi:exonuclease SbcC
VKLNALHLVNFRQHPDTRIEFDLGLTGIIGPNGAGKTTILEAIAWALYGQSAARGTRDSIRYSRAGPRATVRVELDFELAGHRYRVVRGLTRAELYLDEGAEPIADSILGVTELLQRRLGMTRAEFFQTYFTGQKELSVLAAMAPTERAQFLSRVLGYDKLRAAQYLVRERRKTIIAESNGIRTTLPDAAIVTRMLTDTRARVAEAEARRTLAERVRRAADEAYAALAPRWEAAQRTRETSLQILAELRVAQNDETSRLRELERVERELGTMAGAKLELVRLAEEIAPLNEVLDEFRQLEDLAREEGRRQALEQTGRRLDDELRRLRARQAEIARAPLLEREVIEKLERMRLTLDAAATALETVRTEWVRDRQEAETKRDALRTQWGELKAQHDRIVDLGEDGVCPTCTRVLGASFRAVLDQIEEQMETIEVDGRWFSTRLEQLADMPEAVRSAETEHRELGQEVTVLERQRAGLHAALQELSEKEREIAAKEAHLSSLRRELDALPTGYDLARHEALARDVARLGPLNERVTRLSTLIEREPALALERARAVSERDQIRAHAGILREQYEATHYPEDVFARLRSENDAAAAAVRAAELTVSGAVAEEAAAREALTHAERARDDLERTREAYDRLQREKRLHDELDRFYTDLRTDLNVRLRPELSELASSFLERLSDGRYTDLQLDDQYNVVVLEDQVPKSVISGGEEDLTHLVLRLAISQMIAERAGQAFSLLVLDEVFGSLDVARRHNVVELLRRLQDRFEQVILITHIESVRDEFDRVILVDYDEHSGASRVRQSEPAAFPELVAAGAPLEGAGADR